MTRDVVYGLRDVLEDLVYHLEEAQKVAHGTPADVSEQIEAARKALDAIDEQAARQDEIERQAMVDEYWRAVI